MKYLLLLLILISSCSSPKYTISQKMLNRYDGKKLNHIYYSEKTKQLYFRFDSLETLAVPLTKKYLNQK